MTDALLIFTFSPVQPFIMEARRAADLYAGSHILVKLARAAANAISTGGKLIYPDSPSGDVPNKLVARVPRQNAQTLAENARLALLEEWQRIAEDARGAFHKSAQGMASISDGKWNEIWQRQTSHLWEIYWAAVPLEDEEYSAIYKRASRALESVKRTRMFGQTEERSLKDSLSGRREALHTDTDDARKYWQRISAAEALHSRLQPDGRERLDAIGLVKRFTPEAEKFPSTSTIASRDFLNDVLKKEDTLHSLRSYREALKSLLGSKLYTVPDYDEQPKYREWPYDGDLLYMETLTPNRLEDSYNLTDPDPANLRRAREALSKLHGLAGSRPSPYYALIVLDGDHMGKLVGDAAAQGEDGHRTLSKLLLKFCDHVKEIASGHLVYVVYNGGDDVLALAPLSQAVPFAQALNDKFKEIVRGATASAGIAIAHHLYPLDAALRAARDAERAAKDDYGRNALCIRALKRSGEALHVGTRWTDAGDNDFAGLIAQVIGHFREDRLSSRFAYDVVEQAHIVTALEDRAARTAILKRLVNRHKTDKLQNPDDIVKQLDTWAAALDAIVPREVQGGREVPQGFAELGRWLVLARFIAQGGGE